MIEKLRVRNFKALRDVEIELTPIHVLIGPNDTGKTSILDALAALCRSVDHLLEEAFLGSWKNSELVWRAEPGTPVTIEADFRSSSVAGYGVSVGFGADRRDIVVESEYIIDGENRVSLGELKIVPRRTYVGQVSLDPRFVAERMEDARSIQKLLGGLHCYRWNPQFLALPVAPDAKRQFRMEANGFGLALCLDEILSYNRDRFIQLESRFTEFFPQIESIVLQQEPAYRAPVDDPQRVTMLQQADGKGLYFRLRDSGQLVPAAQASDGTLLVLAYLSVLYLPQPPRLLLVEEPENGIHPKRLRDILTVLRELVGEQSHTQIVMTTHSPYVVDLFEPEEVTLCTKLDNGEIKTTRLSDSPAVRRQLEVFTLGEIWTSEGDERIAEPEKPVERKSE
ncbi:MAG: AAA family ATPase [Sedimentisphaerales bacterium]|nr:AAA family ATPase [Sedimentisphaerales bacterium]